MDVPYRVLPDSFGSGPSITMKSRHETKTFSDTPGPSYVPPAMGTDSKKISMGVRTSIRTTADDTPGPGAYNISPKFANDAKKFSMRGRTRNLNEGESISPGPGAYAPNYDATRKRAPTASMHSRPETRSIEVTPGPGEYSISREMGGRAASFHGRPQERNIETTPGPGAYNVGSSMDRRGTPGFTMKSRHETTQQVTAAPYRDLPSTIGQGPKISMYSRHETRRVSDTPGPSYVPPAMGTDSKKISMGIRTNTSHDSRAETPGPGAYNIRPQFATDAKKFSMRSRTKNLNEGESASPGPGAYAPNYDATRKRAPTATMHVRTKMHQPEETPGYVALPSTLGGPKFSIGQRETLDLVPV